MKSKLATMGIIILFLATSISFAVEVEKKVIDAKQSVSPTEIASDKNEIAELAVKAIMAGEEINWQVISGGGTVEGESTLYRLSSTVGQTAVGEGTGGGKVLHHGFMQTFDASSGGCTTAGDANHDGSFNVGDAVFVIANVFKGGPLPVELNEGDANYDCSFNIGDGVYMISNVFKGGPLPQCGCVD
jgi:ApbE superfamily uncharacterized protein (UPF0280 family)